MKKAEMPEEPADNTVEDTVEDIIEAPAEAAVEETGVVEAELELTAAVDGEPAVAADAEALAADAEALAADAEALATDAEAPATDAEAPAMDAEAPATEAVGEATEEAAAPPVDSAARLESIVESLLFASDRPLGLSDLKRLLGERDAKKVTAALEALKARHQDTGIQLASVAGGYQFRTHPENGAWVSKLIAGRPQRLSRALLETLSIVAYRQPVTRPEIDEIRGVDCGPVLKTLLDRGLVRMIGKKEDVGRPILYGTTPEFLRTFSLRDLNELPTLREFHELSEAQKAEVDAETGKPEGAAPAASVASVSSASAERTQPIFPTLPDVPDDEEDALLTELDEATAAATAAVEPEPPRPDTPEVS